MHWAQLSRKDYIRAEHKLHSISRLFISQVIISNVVGFFFFLAYLYSAGTQHGNLYPARWPILFCGPTQKLVLATANTGKNRERFWKKCRWMDEKGRNKQVSVACMAICWATPGFKGRTFKLCVLTRWDFNFCVRSSPLRGFLLVLAELWASQNK